MSFKEILGGVRVFRPSAANLRDPPHLGVFDAFPKTIMSDFGHFLRLTFMANFMMVM